MNMFKYAFFIMVLLLSAAISQAQTERPNFILILSDDQSWKGTSVLMDPDEPESKSDYYKTPNLERLASMGMRFTNGYSPAPFCCPTRRSLQIGQFPARQNLFHEQKKIEEYYEKQPNISGTLKGIDKRYKTAHFGKWDFRSKVLTPSRLGYDESDGATGNAGGGSRDSGGPAAKEDPKRIDDVTDSACAFMETCISQGNPFYVQLSHWAVHLDVYYKQETLDKVNGREKGLIHNLATFAAMTEDLDTGIGRLLDKVEELGLLENTYIIFMSDNGGRIDIPGEEPTELNAPLRSGKGSMYEGGIRVPFMICGPGIEKGVSSDVPVSGVDLLPTMADLAGRPIQHDRLDGGSLKKLLHGESNSVLRNQDYLIFHHAITRYPQSAIRLGDYKLVKTYEENLIELYDLSKDFREQNNLAKKMPEKVQELDAKLDGYLNEVKATKKYTRKKKKSTK